MPTSRPWTRTRCSAIGSSSAGRISASSGKQGEGPESSFAPAARSSLEPRTALWITAQGRFADARERPAGVQPGVAHLARRLKQAVILPLALEYPFWEERYPEALARFGQAIVVERGADRSVEEWRTCIEEALASAQDALAAEAQRRDPAAFETLVGGKAGVGGVYDCWRSLRARRARRPFPTPSTALTGVLPAPGGSS